MVQKRRKPLKKRNPTEEREPSDGSKAPNHADTAKSIGESPRTEWMKRWECAMEVIGLFANVATIVAIVLTGYQIVVGNWQFDRSGPDYTWFMLDRMEPNVRIEADGMSTQSTFAMVLANSGRTEDTVISLSRDTKHAESMRICMPEFDRKGGYKAGSAVLNDKGSFSLAPGESKLLFVVAPRTSMTLTGQTDKDEEYRSESFEITGNLTVYSASGKTWPAKELHPDQRVIRHYEDLSGFRQAKRDCMSLVNKDMEVK